VTLVGDVISVEPGTTYTTVFVACTVNTAGVDTLTVHAINPDTGQAIAVQLSENAAFDLVNDLTDAIAEVPGSAEP
jgi:hypothetical protein